MRIAGGQNWRLHAAQQLAAQLDMETLGIAGVYLFGSAASGETGPCSDIDLLLHITCTEPPKALRTQLAGWNRELCAVNHLLTGYSCDTMLDVHFVTDEDIRHGSSYACHITSLYNPAEPLRVRQGALQPAAV